MTVSFSIEGRDVNGVKKFCQFSVTASRSTGESGWNPTEMPIVKGLISKQVVALTYKDAWQRGVLSGAVAKSELKAALQDINEDIQRYAGSDNGTREG